MDLNFYISNVAVPPPQNWQSLEIEIVFTNNPQDTTSNLASIKTNTLEWMKENASTLNAWVKSGIMGGVGIFEGIPLRIEIVAPQGNIVIFNGCINLVDEGVTFTCDIVKAPCRESKIDWLNDLSDSVSFAYLASIGQIGKSDYIPVPYIRNNIPNYTEVMLMSLGMYSFIKELQESIKRTGELISDLTGDSASTAATAGLTAGQVAADITKVILYIAYIIFIIAVLIEFIIQIGKNLIQLIIPVKYGMKVADLFKKMTNYFGIGFSSTILQTAPFNNLVIIPKKTSYTNTTYSDNFFTGLFGGTLTRRNYDDSKNPTAYGYFEGTFKEFILAMQDVFNAKIVISNNILYFERWDFFNNIAGVTLPPISSEAPFDDPYGTNASEIASNFFLKYQLDSTDFNTYDQYDGTSVQMTLVPIKVNIARNLLLKNLVEKELQFSLVKRKTGFTEIENIVSFLIDAGITIPNFTIKFLNGLIKIINGLLKAIASFLNITLPTIPTIPTITNPVANRIGMMLLQNDFIGVPKLLLVDSTNHVDQFNQIFTSANYLMNNFHSASFAVFSSGLPPNIVTTYPNQYLIFKNKKIPLCIKDFLTLKNNNIIKDFQQRFGRVDSLRWNPFNETADIDYRIKETYTKNLSQTFVIDGQ